MAENVDVRLNKLSSDLRSQYEQKGSVNIEREAKQMLLNYAEELTFAAVENAFVLAQNRQSNEITEADIAIILAKKLGVELPGHEVGTLQNQRLKNSLQYISEEFETKKQGSKRKLPQ